MGGERVVSSAQMGGWVVESGGWWGEGSAERKKRRLLAEVCEDREEGRTQGEG